MIADPRALDATFRALANPTRRAVLERLRAGPVSVSELAAPFEMALPSFMQHLQVLEEGGLVESRKQGRVRWVHARPQAFQHAAGWLAEQLRLWQRRLDQLDDYLATMEAQHDPPG